MFETPLTVVGNIVNDPICRTVGEQEVINFRVASNSRRRGADGTWEQGNTLFVAVSCWGRLVTGVSASLRKGSPVVVTGHVHSRDYEDRDGVKRSSVEMRATAVGPDLSRCIARVEKVVPAGPDAPVSVIGQSEAAEGSETVGYESDVSADDELAESA